MSDKNINNMDFKELRNEVQLLRDELAMFKRGYEDVIYNLDSDNFGKSFKVEQNKLKAQVKVTAEAIKTAVTDETLGEELKKYSTIEQTADAITSTVAAGANLKDAEVIVDISQATDKSKTYKIQDFNSSGQVIGESYYYYNSLSKDWEKISGDTIYTMFTQTSEGFVLKGNTVIDGTTTITRNLKLSGNVTWDMNNSPVLTQYSSDGVSWHSPMVDGDMYMQMSFDGGKSWSNTTKVVGTDGKNGTNGWNGSDAYVTAENVFNALTSGGTEQGLFPAFYEDEEKLFINAEYIKTGTLNADRIDTDTISATRLYAKGYKSGYYAKMASNVGDFGVYKSSASSSANPASGDCVWGIYNSDVTTQVVNMYAYGTNYLGYNKSQDKTYPKGVWDFTSCTPIGLSTSGGTTTAVFG